MHARRRRRGRARTAGLADEFDVIVVDRRLPGRDGIERRRDVARAPGRRAHPDADRARHRRRPGQRTGRRRQRLPGEAVRVRRAPRAPARAHSARSPAKGRRCRSARGSSIPESRCIYSPYDGRIQLTVRESALAAAAGRESAAHLHARDRFFEPSSKATSSLEPSTRTCTTCDARRTRTSSPPCAARATGWGSCERTSRRHRRDDVDSDTRAVRRASRFVGL